jgi:hypothetical protein
LGVAGIGALFIGVCFHMAGQFDIVSSKLENLKAVDNDGLNLLKK